MGPLYCLWVPGPLPDNLWHNQGGGGGGGGGGDIEHSDSSQRLADHDVMMTLTLTRNTMSYKL